MRGWGVVAAVLCVGCTYDFDSFMPGAVDAAVSADGSSDAPVDSGCTPTDAQSPCFAAATACAASCRSKRATCEAACTKPGCTKGCANEEAGCRTACANECSSCSTAAGCAAPAQCWSSLG
ncbi:MAG: hypothetical protein HYV09_31685 [Deltaproteobacteria bacterium]|nr:hypothetical protein [Deltaproteobacteria bacterium]